MEMPIRPGERLLLLLDYDGTLTPIRPRPEQARLASGSQRLLDRLSRFHRVVLISGRDIASLKRLANPGPRVGLVGTHGAECSGLAGLRLVSAARLKRLRLELKRVFRALQGEFAGEPGLEVEAKSVSVALHYRRANPTPRIERALRSRFKRCVRRTLRTSRWSFQEGRMMIDLKPRGFDKGTAVRALRRLFPALRVLVAGDDLTDLAAFRASGPKAIRIAVGFILPKSTCDFRLRSSADFMRFLNRSRRGSPRMSER